MKPKARYLTLATIGGAVTLLVWVIHLWKPLLFVHGIFGFSQKYGYFGPGRGGGASVILAVPFFLTPPFLLAFGLLSALFDKPENTPSIEPGPMASYLSEGSDRQRIITVISGAISGLNLLLMILVAAQAMQ